MKFILPLIISIFVVNSCSTEKEKEDEPVQADENLPLNQILPNETNEDLSTPSETDEDLSTPSETDEKVDSKPVTLIIGDYLDRSIAPKMETLDLKFFLRNINNQGAVLFNLHDEDSANQQNSPYYQYATNQFPNNRIVQSSKASATVTDAKQLMENAMEEIDKNEVIDQIIISLGTLDFCLSTANFSEKYKEMLAFLSENKSLESATFTIITPIDLTQLPFYPPVLHAGKEIYIQHQFCPALGRQEAEENFKKILQIIMSEMAYLSTVRTVFTADISDIAMTFNKIEMADEFNFSQSGIEKIATSLEEEMVEIKLDFANYAINN